MRAPWRTYDRWEYRATPRARRRRRRAVGDVIASISPQSALGTAVWQVVRASIAALSDPQIQQDTRDAALLHEKRPQQTRCCRSSKRADHEPHLVATECGQGARIRLRRASIFSSGRCSTACLCVPPRCSTRRQPSYSRKRRRAPCCADVGEASNTPHAKGAIHATFDKRALRHDRSRNKVLDLPRQLDSDRAFLSRMRRRTG